MIFASPWFLTSLPFFVYINDYNALKTLERICQTQVNIFRSCEVPFTLSFKFYNVAEGLGNLPWLGFLQVWLAFVSHYVYRSTHCNLSHFLSVRLRLLVVKVRGKGNQSTKWTFPASLCFSHSVGTSGKWGLPERKKERKKLLSKNEREDYYRCSWSHLMWTLQ